MKILQTLLLLAVAMLLAGCMGLGQQPMSPEQMAQNVKDKNSVVGCTYGLGIHGQGGAVYVDTNKINDNQSVVVDEKCKVTVTGTKAAPAVPK